MEKSGSQINQSIGSEKCSRNRRLPLEPVKLARRVKRQQRQHSPSSSLHLLLNFFSLFFRLLVVVYTKYTLSLSFSPKLVKMWILICYENEKPWLPRKAYIRLKSNNGEKRIPDVSLLQFYFYRVFFIISQKGQNQANWIGCESTNLQICLSAMR